MKVIEKAMRQQLGHDADEVPEQLSKHGISWQYAKRTLDIAKQDGRFTIFSLVDALTRLASRIVNIGERLELDAKAAQLLTLAL